MTITQCQLMRDAREGTFEKYGVRTISERYLVESDDRFDGPTKIWELGRALTRTATTAPLPELQSYYIEYDSTGAVETKDTGIFMMKMAIRQHDSAYRWIATANYRKLKEGEGFDGEGDVDHPRDLPIRYWLDFVSSSEVVKVAANLEELGPGITGVPVRGVNTPGPIVNGALKNHDEPLERIKHRTFLVAERPFMSLTEMMAIPATFDKTANASDFYGWQPGHARFAGISSSQKLELNGVSYYSGTIRVELGKDIFDHEVQNYGWTYYTMDDEEVEVTGPDPVQLTNTGLKSSEQQEVIHYRDLTPANYSGLGI